MPPKQKQAKKGPTYKPATPFKDMVPGTIKQPPREPKPLKIPDTQAQNPDKNKPDASQNMALFEQWPSEQNVKAHDFGIASDVKFEDKAHDAINQYLKKEIQEKVKMYNWKKIHEVFATQENSSQQQDRSQQQDQQGHKSSVNLQSQKKNNSQANIAQSKNKPLVVIQTYLRQQTEQQMQKRKKQQAQKAQKAAKDKKKGKKQQPKQQGPLQVSDVKMSNILTKKYMCSSGIWIGSQLQIVKIRNLRDVYNDQPVWKKIYPQENGVPQITKSGKYWVKLYYMGKPVKVQIDDRIPLSHDSKQLFPKSQKYNQKWTQILTKALIKLLALSNPKTNVVGSGIIINALTGMITQNIKIRSYSQWQKFEQMMNDIHYDKKDIIISCYSHHANRKTPSNFIRNKQQMKEIITLQNSTFKRKANKRNSAVQLGGMKIQEQQLEEAKIQEQYVQSNLIAGYSYCIGDYFENKDFNMVFSKQKSLRQQKLKVQYNQMSKVVLGNKTRQEKLQHRKKKKQIKQKLQIQQKKRYDQIKKPMSRYHFIKLLSDLLIKCEYTNKQILLAKKCVLNKLQYPPNYQIPVIEKVEKQKQESKIGSTTQIKFKQDHEINPPLDDFSAIGNIQELKLRNQEGIWIKNEDLLTIFDEFQFYYNPNIFQFKSIQFVTNKTPKQFTTDENKEILVVQKRGNPYLQNKQQGSQIQKQQKIALLFGFAFQQSKWDTLCDPYCMLQKFDFQSYRTASNVTTLSQPLSSTYLFLNNNNSVFRIYTISKGRYAYWISSDSKFKLLSLADYLIQFQAYTQKNFNIQYPPIEKKTLLTLSRIKVKHQGQQTNTLFLKIKNCPKDIQKYLVLKIVQIPAQGPYTQQQQEGIIEKKHQNTHLVYQYTRAQLSANKSYFIVVEAYPSQNIIQGTFQLQVLSKISNNFQISQSEQIQPYKIVQKYNPNKYGTILKQRLFCNNKINTSIIVKIFQGEQGQPIQTDKKASKKGGKEEPTFEIIQKQLKQKRLIHVKIFKNKNLIYYDKSYNQVIISNIQFEKTKEDVIYYMQASFDLREWPGAKVASDQTTKICWSAQITGQDAVAFVKDTLQEEKQKQTRKSWQDKQPGRAEKAKKARQKFLLQLKQQKGEALTQEELQIINAPRMTKKKLLQEQKKNEDKKGAKGAKKDDKKAGKDKKQQVVQQKKQERPAPKSQNNFMKQIKQFLKNLQDCKVQKIQLEEGKEARIRSQQQQNSIRQGALMSKENRAAQIIRNIQSRQVMKVKQKDKKDKLTILLQDTKTNFNREWKQYLQWRIQDQEKDKSKQQKQKALIQIINQEKPTINEADLNKLVGQYRNIEGHNPKLADVVDLIKKNIKIANITEKINNSLQGWQVEALKAAQEEIKNQKIEGINQQVLTKLNNMMQQVAKNPAIVAQKQAQLKKIKKPGKK